MREVGSFRHKGWVFALLFLCILLVTLASCGQRPQPLYSRTIATNGDVFVYSRADPFYEGEASRAPFHLVVADKDGEVKRLINSGRDYVDLGAPAFGERGFYYIKTEGRYNRKAESTLMKCSLEMTDCHPLVKRKGKMGGFFELDDGNMVFLLSRYVEDKTDEYGWGHFQFYRLDVASGAVTQLKAIADFSPAQPYIDEGFFLDSPVYRFGQTVYFGAPEFARVAEYEREGLLTTAVRGEMSGDSIRVYRMRDEFSGKSQFSYSVIVKIPVGEKTVYKLTPEGINPFVWQVCVVDHRYENDCPNRGRSTTFPVIRDGKVYYGLWDETTHTMHFESIDL